MPGQTRELARTVGEVARAVAGRISKSWSGPTSPGGPTPVASLPWNWWQYSGNYNRDDYAGFGPVQTCINIISQDISRLPLQHVRIDEESGARTNVRNKAPMRLFRKPNSFQSRSDFMLYLMRSLLMDGNAYAWAQRNEKNEVVALYPLPPWSVYPYVTPDEGEVVYRISHSQVVDIADPVIEQGTWAPARNLLHIRLQTPHNPLMGESPLMSAKYPATTGMHINQHVSNFFANMSRPGGVLRHPGELKPEAMMRIKESFKEISSGHNIGDVAILMEGMEWQQMQMTAVDAEVAAIYKLSERAVFQLFRVPSFLGGDMDKTTFNNVESLLRFYLQSCLGFYVDHIEDALTDFLVPRSVPDEWILFDLDQALLAGDFRERMEALGKAVQSGVYTHNEARARENLKPVEFGDEPRVQQQMVPLSFGAQQAAVPSLLTPEEDEDEMETESAREMRAKDLYQKLRKAVYQ